MDNSPANKVVTAPRPPILSLMECVRANDLLTCRYWLDLGVDIDATDAAGNTALNLAAREGFMDISSLLIEHGANVNAIASNGRSILHHAVWRAQEQTTVLLLESGANVHALDGDRRSPLNLGTEFDRNSNALAGILKSWIAREAAREAIESINHAIAFEVPKP